MISANSKVVHLHVVDIWPYMCNVNIKLNEIICRTNSLNFPIIGSGKEIVIFTEHGTS